MSGTFTQATQLSGVITKYTNFNVLWLLIPLMIILILVEFVPYFKNNKGSVAILGMMLILLTFAFVPRQNEFVYKYSYNLSLGGYVEFEVKLQDNNHLSNLDTISVYKEIRKGLFNVNFNKPRVEMEQEIKEIVEKTLLEKYGLNPKVDALITVF